MKKLCVALLAFGGMTGVAAAEPVTLSDAKLGLVSAAGFDFQSNSNWTYQSAKAYSSNKAACVVCIAGHGGSNASIASTTVANNSNKTYQSNR